MRKGDFVTLRDASELLNVSYQTVLNNKAEYGAVEIDAPGNVQYAIPARFVREFLEEQFEELKERIELFNNGKYRDPLEVYRRHDPDKREEEMLRLRFEELWTLQEIGDKFGLTRERVRQIIGNSGHGYKHKRIRKEVRSMNGKTIDEGDIHDGKHYRPGATGSGANHGTRSRERAASGARVQACRLRRGESHHARPAASGHHRAKRAVSVHGVRNGPRRRGMSILAFFGALLIWCIICAAVTVVVMALVERGDK